MAVYLSLKELWRGRGRFLLISMVIALITLLVLFVAGLAEGLGSGNIEYLSKIDADVIVYQENSQLSIGASRLDRSKLGDIARLDGVQAVGPLAFSSATIVLPDGRKPLDISLIGVEPGKPGEVPVREGKSFESRRANEAVIDRNTALRTNLKVGDTVTLKAVQGTKEEFYPLTVVGISDGQQYSLRPSVFVPDMTWDKVRPRSGQLSTDITYNVFAVKLDDATRTKEFVQSIPQNVALPDSDAAKSAADWHAQSDRRAQSHRGGRGDFAGHAGYDDRRGDWHGADSAAGGQLPGLGADCIPCEFNRHRDCVAAAHRSDRWVGVRAIFAAHRAFEGAGIGRVRPHPPSPSIPLPSRIRVAAGRRAAREREELRR
jgi:hypothetical protein